VCIVSEDAEAEARLLIPFVRDGLEAGDRCVHIVDPAGFTAYLDRLDGAGIDTRTAIANGQLDVRTWDEWYLAGGSFDRDAMVARLRRLMAEGRDLGFPRTRFIGYTGFAATGALGIEQLVPYEAQVGRELRGLPDFLLCAYDLSQHDRATVMESALTHEGVVMDGVLRPSGGQAASPRERVLAAAAELFHRRGVAATGVDLLIDVADVAKASFYRHFPSKDDLVLAWLRDPRTRWFDNIRTTVNASVPGGDGAAAVIAFFERVGIWLSADGNRGDPYVGLHVEIPDPTHPARLVASDYLAEIEAWLRDRVVSTGRPNAEILAHELFVLLVGGMQLSVARDRVSVFEAVIERVPEILDGAPA
jgi:AcrR family transcriptional regulator